MTLHDTRPLPSLIGTLALAVAALAIPAQKAAAQHTVNLIAAQFNKTVTLPSGIGVQVPMWGFALDLDGDGVLDPAETTDTNGNGILDPAEVPTVPGPPIVVPPGAAGLRINLTNTLQTPVSIVIPGYPAAIGPDQRNADGRVRSFAPEAGAGGGSATYVFNLRPGTYLYHSGSHPAVQVQMGLYGAVTAGATGGTPAEAYAGVPYDAETVLVFSEIDTALHDAVAAGTYGTTGPTSTIDYKPSLFLLNGESYTPSAAALPAGAAGQRTLVRMLNAGLATHVVVIDGATLSIVAEDGNKLGDARLQASVLLPAGKTHDAIWTPAAGGDFAAYDRALRLEASTEPSGGMLATLRVSGAPAASSTNPDALQANADAYPAFEDLPLTVAAAAGILANDTPSGSVTARLDTPPRFGTLTLNADGSFSYVPSANYQGPDEFFYRAVTAGGDGSVPARVALSVAAVADRPLALPLALSTDQGVAKTITLTGTDPDGDPVTIRVTQAPAAGTGTLNVALNTTVPGGTVVFTPAPGYAGPASFSFVAADASLVSDPAATVSITVNPAAAVPTGTPLALQVVGVDARQPSAEEPVSQYRWTVEEDLTYNVQPGVLDPETLSVSFHRSYMPVVQSGTQATTPQLQPGKRYFVSVLPSDGGFSNGGVPVIGGATNAKVVVTKGPLPTARVRVQVFHDSLPLNGQFDTDEEPLVGFHVYLDDAGGRYGMAGGQMMQDAFGNPLGTTYAPCDTPPCDSYQVASRGNGFLVTDEAGFVTFENLAPGKYTAKVIPPPGQDWQQTSTIEGTKGIDAWVKANEPPFFTEFGPAGPHVQVGFVRPTRDPSALNGSQVISGTVTGMHMSRPPTYTMFSGAPFDYTTVWVGLNIGTTGRVIYAQPAGEECDFRITGVPDGSYTLVVWDSALDLIVASKSVTVSGASLDLRDVPVFPWFTRLYHYVFEDRNQNGQRDAGEPGIPEMAINTRWRDGSMYQSSATDGSGFVPFEETFPFFSWQIAEVDYTRLRATGVTVVVDNGGNVNTNTGWPDAVGADADSRVLAPQPQSENGGGGSRTETGPVLLQAFQGFIGQTNVFLWGKAPYDLPGSHPPDVDVAPFHDPDAGEPFPGVGDTDGNGNGTFDPDQFNGGISGIVHYSTTRAENLARWGAAEPWEPGIPGVKVQLWDATGQFLLNEVETDSWDASRPTGCQGTPFTFLGTARDCFDGLRVFNQVRPGVFDGGYAFYTILQSPVAGHEYDLPLDQRTVQKPLPAADYRVKVIVPEGYQLVKEEDKNVDFGDEYIPAQFYLTGYDLGDAAGGGSAPPPEGAVAQPLAAPFCVGTPRVVPPTLALFPDVPGAYAGASIPVCDTKLVTLRDGQNGAANFFLFTEAPVAGHIVGFVLDDLANEFDQNSPQFGEKWAPPFLPVSVRDWAGREITHTYTDRYGVYNALVPSTFTAATPIPSGMSPNMLTACINSPLMADGTPDPFYNKQYSQFCYTLQYMPGTTTYLDTPVVPTGAFTGPNQVTLDAELRDGTPVIKSVNGPAGIGPYVVPEGSAASRTITIASLGTTAVANPAYDPNTQDGQGNAKTVNRDYGFGDAEGRVFVGAVELPSLGVTWGNLAITAEVPPGTPTGQLRVIRCLSAGCGTTRESALGVTLTVATPSYHAARPPRTVSAGQSIQAAIDAAAPGDLVIVGPGTYQELVVMDKPIRLQGWGAPSTIINAVKVPAEKMQSWVERVAATTNAAGTNYLLPSQEALGPDPEAIAPILGGAGAAITVLAQGFPGVGGAYCPQTVRPLVPRSFGLHRENSLVLFGIPLPIGGEVRAKARIDGFGITGSDQAAGIEVNAYACNLEVANNHVYSNLGDFAGGVKIGHPGEPGELADDNAHNDYVAIAFNHVSQNGALGDNGGGGIAIGSGAYGYRVQNNFVVGNFTSGFGAGISHIGRSDEGTIAGNIVIFNESFNQSATRAGGGIYVGGRAPAAGEAAPGVGNVTVASNLVLGNSASGGDGGGIGVGWSNAAGTPNLFKVGLYGNTIVNNVAGLAGGGISLENATNVDIIHNTIADNDSLAIAGAAFTAVSGAISEPFQSSPQPAGIVARGASAARVVNSIVWRNRSFYFGFVPGGIENPYNNGGPTYGLIASSPAFRNFGALGGASLVVRNSVVSERADLALGPGNVTTAPLFAATYSNGNPRQTIVAPELTTAIQVPAAFDEGGNFIRPMFGPLTLTRPGTDEPYRDYHVEAGVNGQPLFNSQVGGGGLYPNLMSVPATLRTDVDGDSRTSSGIYPHRGADQVGPTLAIGDAWIIEGDGAVQTMTFTVTLSTPSDTEVTVNFATSQQGGGARGGSATCSPAGVQGCDFVNASGTVTFAPGATSRQITVTIKGDTRAEDREVFFVNLTSPVNALLGRARGTGTILNND